MKLEFEVDRPGRVRGAEKFKRIEVKLPPGATVEELAEALGDLLNKEFDDPNLRFTLSGPGLNGNRPLSEWRILVDGNTPFKDLH